MEKLNFEQNALILEHTAYAIKLAHQITTNVVDQEELEHEAVARLCDAALWYKGRNGATFESYAYSVITFGLLRLIENFRRHGITDKVDVDGAEFRESDEVAEMPYVDFENREMVEKLLGGLTYEERVFVQLRYGLLDGVEMTLKDVGRMLGMTKEEAYNFHRRVVRKMKRFAILDSRFSVIGE